MTVYFRTSPQIQNTQPALYREIQTPFCIFDLSKFKESTNFVQKLHPSSNTVPNSHSKSRNNSKMVYSYTPTYYSTLQDSITSLCKTILPFSFKKRCLPPAELKLSKLQSDNLKWQQDSFHHMLNLMGLQKEGIVAESEVSAFRTNLLETLIASPADHEHPTVLRDKLLFLQVSSAATTFFFTCDCVG